ncbi:MAG: recombinase family protein [Cellulosilyticaceae bacterium]
MKTCIYLRKSRADEELERLGQGNTLNRHRDTLVKLASDMNITVSKIYEEIVSGESLNHRPAMLELLQNVSDGEYDAVIVMDMDRLGRGNMQEQGLILETFKHSKTKIITPRKTYDLENEFDEEYSEFEAFMARKELKIITRRMQRGRQKSVEEGNYLGTYAPYGYELVGKGRDRKLVINPYTAPAVKLIFELYAAGKGGNHIATQLNKLGYKTATGKNFYNHSILNIIKNPVYIGKLTWKKKITKKGTPNKRRTVELKPRSEWDLYEGKHDAIISEELYNAALLQLNQKTHVPYSRQLTNPLAGLIFCEACDFPMMYRPYSTGSPHLVCYNHYCKATRSSRFDYVEKMLIEQLELLAKHYETSIIDIKDEDFGIIEIGIKNTMVEIAKLNKQQSSLHNLLEQGVYSIDTFLERDDLITNRLGVLNTQLLELKARSKKTISNKQLSMAIKNALSIYLLSDNIELKNQALKKIIQKIIYSKSKSSKPRDFKLTIQLRI